MNIIKIGQIYINMERVTSIRDLSSKGTDNTITQGLFRVYFTSDDYIEFSSHSTEFRDWLAGITTDLPTPVS